VVVAASAATRLKGSCARMASSTASDTWSHSLSGWPSVTDSEVKSRRGEFIKVLLMCPPPKTAGTAPAQGLTCRFLHRGGAARSACGREDASGGRGLVDEARQVAERGVALQHLFARQLFQAADTEVFDSERGNRR